MNKETFWKRNDLGVVSVSAQKFLVPFVPFAIPIPWDPAPPTHPLYSTDLP